MKLYHVHYVSQDVGVAEVFACQADDALHAEEQAENFCADITVLGVCEV